MASSSYADFPCLLRWESHEVFFAVARQVLNLLREELRGRSRSGRCMDCQIAVDLHRAEEPGRYDLSIERLGVRVEGGTDVALHGGVEYNHDFLIEGLRSGGLGWVRVLRIACGDRSDCVRVLAGDVTAQCTEGWWACIIRCWSL
jgi:hypothetical protein